MSSTDPADRSQHGAGDVQPSQVTPINPLFARVFYIVAGFTLIAFALNAGMAIMIDSPSPEEIELIGASQSAWQSGFVAIIGLIGGKAMA